MAKDKKFWSNYFATHECYPCKKIKEAIAPIIHMMYIMIIEMAYMFLGENQAQFLVYFLSEVSKTSDLVGEAIWGHNDMFMDML